MPWNVTLRFINMQNHYANKMCKILMECNTNITSKTKHHAMLSRRQCGKTDKLIYVTDSFILSLHILRFICFFESQSLREQEQMRQRECSTCRFIAQIAGMVMAESVHTWKAGVIGVISTCWTTKPECPECWHVHCILVTISVMHMILFLNWSSASL